MLCREKRAPSPEEESLKSMLAHRHNIYDGDEFDVFSGANVDLSRVHVGKKWVNTGIIDTIVSPVKPHLNSSSYLV